MKKVILMLVIGFITFGAGAQTVKEADVPASVKSTFNTQCSGKMATSWKKEKGNYVAMTTMDGKDCRVVIEPNGKYVKTETKIMDSELPKDATAYCEKTLSGKKVSHAMKIEDASGKTTYEAKCEDKEIVFDSNGKFIKEVKEKPKGTAKTKEKKKEKEKEVAVY